MIHYMTTFGVGDAWVGNELRIVHSRGVPFILHAMRAPTRKLFASEWAAKLAKETRVIYPLPPAGMIVSTIAAPFLFGGRFFSALGNALFGKRESLRNRIATLVHFFVACHWARGLRHETVTHIHSQWIHSGGSIAMYGAWLLGKSFSFTGHAADLFRDRVALEDKIHRAEFIVCISEFHRQFFKNLGARDEQLHIVYCGIDLDHFKPVLRERRQDQKLHILSSGRLVEKKGFSYLLEACRILRDRGLDFECTIGGSGPLERELKDKIEHLRLSDLVRVTGQEITQDDLPRFMNQGDIYCLPCVWASDNDVDGLPQMLMEAMACGMPAISTRLVGIPDLVVHEKTGLLVEPNDSQALADAILRLHEDPQLARRLAQAGREWIAQTFDINTSLEPLIRLFRAKLQGAQAVEKTEDAASSAAISGVQK